MLSIAWKARSLVAVSVVFVFLLLSVGKSFIFDIVRDICISFEGTLWYVVILLLMRSGFVL